MRDVRYNLDPFQERSDEEIWSALEKCHMTQTVRHHHVIHYLIVCMYMCLSVGGVVWRGRGGGRRPITFSREGTYPHYFNKIRAKS